MDSDLILIGDGPEPSLRVLLDLTTAWNWRGRRAVGIIRAEREIALRLLHDASLRVLPFVFHSGRMRAVDQVFAESILTENVPSTAVSSFSEPRNERTPGSRDAARAALVAPFGSAARFCARTLLLGVPRRARDEVRLLLIQFRAAIRHLIYRASAVAPTSGSASSQPTQPDLSLVIHPKRGDVLFTCGLGWTDFDWSLIARLKARHGLRVVSMVYDLIPILFPQWIPAGPDVYLAHFLNLIDTADAVPCISQCTRRDVCDFAKSHGRTAPLTRVVYLGADLPAKADPSGLDKDVVARLSSRRFALAVGTFEVRKNYGFLLDIWDRLVAHRSFDLDLVIVGMRGWQADDVIARMQSSPLFGTRIFWLRDIGDNALSWLYEQCSLALYPSLYEGWGLPVVEALQHRRPVIAANRGAVPEAAFGTAQIIDPENVSAWCEAIEAIARMPGTDKPPVKLPTWDDTASAIRSIIRACALAESEFAA